MIVVDKAKLIFNVKPKKLPQAIEDFLLTASEEEISEYSQEQLFSIVGAKPIELSWRDFVLAGLGRWDCPGCGREVRINTKCCRTAHFKSRKPKETKLASRDFFKAKKLGRLPAWCEVEQINQFYLNCPTECRVGYIIPLHGRLVSGLHVLSNLQYLAIHDNKVKKNSYTP